MASPELGRELNANLSASVVDATRYSIQNLTTLSSSLSNKDIGILGLHDVTSSTAILLLLAWLGFMAVFHTRRKHLTKQKQAKEFEDFLVKTKSTRTAKKIPYGFISSWKHKFNLLFQSPTDLLGETYGRNFQEGGATYALYDSYGLPKVVHTIDPENVHAAIASKSQDFGIPAARLVAIGPIKSKGVVMTEGQVWLQNRKIINVGFRGARFTGELEKNLRTLFLFVASVTDRTGWTKPFPLFETIAMMSLDRSIKHMFGVRAELQSNTAESNKLRDRWNGAFDTIGRYVAVRSVLGKVAWLYDSYSFRNACGVLRNLCSDVIRSAISNSRQGITNDASFVGNLVQETADAQQICGVTLDVFIAGHNMTAGVLTWLFLELENRPDVYDGVRAEVLERFGTEAQPKDELTWENLQKCQKLHDCIYEAMRMHPTLPNIGRQAIRDTVLPTGGGLDGKQPIAITKGTVVMCCLYLMHRRPEEWGSDTNKYEPGRWIDREPGHEYAPFGGGPRVCPGQLFALVEMYYVVARIMQRFKAFKQAGDRVDVGGSGAGVLIPPEGVELQVQVAEQ